MKKIIIFLFLNIAIYSNAQNFDTAYTQSYKRTFCGPEAFRFSFGKDEIIRTDLFYKTTEHFVSRRLSTEYTDDGLYREIWTPSFYLKEKGLDAYNQIKEKFYQILYDKKEETCCFF
ncbi:hypothetical protein [Flavobacterium sp. 3HN19-14]|uniref:hypothetical protein n=1 Tax=Flavobacterium sp. 3HN19-14 TaxID=3448133 RepID=UPI003EE3929C